VTSHGFSIVRELTGHGVGRSIHEPPDVPNYSRRPDRQPLREGLVIAVESLIAAGPRPGSASRPTAGCTRRSTAVSRRITAHHEHTIVVTTDAPIILTAAG
jgi:methionyl aminopeptidase